MKLSVALVFMMLAMSATVRAHHSYVSKYDGGKVIKLSGTVAGVSYKNPHIIFTLATASGSWTIESESIPVVRAAGLTEAILKAGVAATVTGWPAKSGSAQLGLKSITIGGRTMTLRGSAR
ncbi:MAG: DUF6152 family protein [Hyphomicrobium sp.]